MKRFLYVALSLALVVLFLSATEKQAYAYVDPGSSLILYQGASSILLGVVYYFRRRLKSLFSRKPAAIDMQGGTQQ